MRRFSSIGAWFSVLSLSAACATTAPEPPADEPRAAAASGESDGGGDVDGAPSAELTGLNLNPSCGLNDPAAQAARLQLIKDSLSCAASAMCAIVGGVTRPPGPDVIPGVPTITPDIGLGSPTGDACAATTHVVLALMFQDPNLLTDVTIDAAVRILARNLADRGVIPQNMVTALGPLGLARTLYDCGTTIINGSLQLAADVGCLINELNDLAQSEQAVQNACKNFDGYVSCNQVCRNSGPQIDAYFLRNVACTNPQPVPPKSVVIDVLGTAIGRRCRQTYCQAGISGQVTQQGQCGYDGAFAQQALGMTVSEWLDTQCLGNGQPPPPPAAPLVCDGLVPGEIPPGADPTGCFACAPDPNGGPANWQWEAPCSI